MANLFIKQAVVYAEARPSYPKELFQFIASKTKCHDLAWDVGTGSGQAAVALAEFFKHVVGTDASPTQIAAATKHPNVRSQHTSPTMSLDELTEAVGPKSSVDLITVAQAMHWFDLPTFYNQVKHVLKPGGVLAAWCYTLPQVNEAVDAVSGPLYTQACGPYWAPEVKLVDDEYKTIDFPFEAVQGEEHTGPFGFEATKSMDLGSYLGLFRSWSAYTTARDKGVELLTDEVVKEFEVAWGGDTSNGSDGIKLVRYPVHLRIGRTTKLL